MLRLVHSLTGLIAALFLIFSALSGSMLSLEPGMQRAVAIVPARGSLTVAQVAETLQNRYKTIEQIERRPTGAIVVYFTDAGKSAAVVVDPNNGNKIEAFQPSAFFNWIKLGHRALWAGDLGRLIVGIVAALMLVMLFTGSWLLLNRVGGWQYIFRDLRFANSAQSPRLHLKIARIVMLALLFSAVTGCWLSAIRFNLIAGSAELEAEFPQQAAFGSAKTLGALSALQQTDLTDLHQLIFPAVNDPQAMFALRTHQGSGYIDQVTGAWLSYADYGNGAKLETAIAELHTGEAYWWFGLMLGLASLTVPILAVTGCLIWWQRQSAMPILIGNTAKHLADTIVLVGSETNTTWGFAHSLCKALQKVGCRVHLASMNQLAVAYPKARRLLILTSTYGDGEAPSSATAFLQLLDKMPASAILPWAVLGFGDRQFQRYCAFADQVDSALQLKHWPQLLATTHIDRQSLLGFEQWGTALANALALPIVVHYLALPRPTSTLVLVARQNFGIAVQAPTAILTFNAVKGGKLAKFRAGDLIAIVPRGSDLPRLYSIATSSKSGELEICVRAQPSGLCSSQLFELKIGDTIAGYIQLNPRFKPCRGATPLLLIGAGTGLAPLVGFIRANKSARPIYLYWGGRLASADFLYHEELILCLADTRLTQLTVAFSRASTPAYVQDKLRQDAEHIQQLMARDPQILVCGARIMASDVAKTLDEIFEPLAIDVAALRTAGRYLEDSY